MCKILETEVRNNLYKVLVDAGYGKLESKRIVGQKYIVALKEKVMAKMNSAIETISSEDFSLFEEKWLDELNGDLSELQKVKELLSDKTEEN